MKSVVVHGQPSFKVASTSVEAFVTQQAGMLSPVNFKLKGQTVQPFQVAPWAMNGEEIDKDLPPLLHALRGDFFCLPFGGNETAYKGEQHPPHGETANSKWSTAKISETDGVHELRMSLNTKVRKGRVEKLVRVIDGHNAVYQKHTVTGMSGPMSPGHHAILQLPDEPECGRISTSPIQYGQVLPFPVENPEIGGYHALKPGGRFKSLRKVPANTGGHFDLSRYPARRGFDDLSLVVNKPGASFAWTAVTFPKQRYAFFTLKDPRMLKSTAFWMSNGGRHYHPWDGRHINVLGIEDVTANFHIGLAESVKTNPLSKLGYPTRINISAKKPLVVNYIMGMCSIPAGFDEVKSIKAAKDNTILLTSLNGKQAKAKVDSEFLTS